jgi:hypothetical protein
MSYINKFFERFDKIIDNRFNLIVNTRKNFVGICTIILLFFGYKLTDNNIKVHHKAIFSNPSYTVGEVTFFSESKSALQIPKSGINCPKQDAYVKYKYVVKGDSYEAYTEGRNFIFPNPNPKKHEKYIVIFLKSEPRESIMLFDYPIRDTTDFVKYLEIFKINPPKLANIVK